MINPIRLTPITKTSIDNKLKSTPIVQPRSRKRLVFFHQSDNFLSPIKNTTNPEIIHPVLTARSSDKSFQKEITSSSKIKTSLSDPIFTPLDPLSPTKQKKNHASKRHRNSCSLDISWSPDLFSNDNNIRSKKMTNSEDEKEDNDSLLEHIGSTTAKTQASPLCNIVEI